MPHVLAPLLDDPRGEYRLTNARTARVLADRLLPAFDSATRRTGLLKHASLQAGSAMVIAPSAAIHTFFMRFVIDVAFVDRGGRVVKACPSVRPWRIALAPRAFAAIELPAGTLESTGTVTGDRLFLTAGG